MDAELWAQGAQGGAGRSEYTSGPPLHCGGEWSKGIELEQMGHVWIIDPCKILARTNHPMPLIRIYCWDPP
eukprot:1158280-Pelagomonas_calceolata.AAC.10